MIGEACIRHGWTLAEFAALDLREQEFWMRWELRRVERFNEMMRNALKREKPSAEVISAQLLGFLVRNG